MVAGCRPSGAGWEADLAVGATTITCRLPERLAEVGGELVVTAVDPPWFGPDGAAVAGPHGVARTERAPEPGTGRPVTDQGAGGGGTVLRLARQARGFSQQQLAGMAGVSRQAVSAVESGLSDPSLRVALALARALGMTVEEVFGPGIPASPVSARPVAPLDDETARVTLAPMGDAFVALPLAGALGQQGRVPPGRRPRLRRRRRRRGTRCSRSGCPGRRWWWPGCDPAMPLLETPLGLLDPPVALSWWPCPSEEALRLAADGLVHVAGAHLRGRSGDYNTGPAGELLPQGAEVIGFCSWREGLVLRPDLADGITGLGDVAAPGAAAGEPGTGLGGAQRARPRAGRARDRRRRSCPVTAPGRPGTCRWPRPSPPGLPTSAWPASPPPSPTAWPSSRWPPSASTW